VTPEAIIAALGLAPHPEGGHYAEIWRDPACTAIYFLLRAGETSHWHRVNATEIWHFHAGAPLALDISSDGVTSEMSLLGTDLAAGHRPQVVVPAESWQSARSLGDWSLLGCTVSPAFQFDGFTLAPPSWRPGVGPP
jgi:predicted cupin superfamily sugar epimerase